MELEDLKLELSKIVEGLRREDSTFNAIRENMSSLIALITLINERILQSLKDIERNAKSDEEHREKHTELQSLITKSITDLNVVSIELRQHSADAGRMERRTENYDIQIREILSILGKLSAQSVEIHDTIKEVAGRVFSAPPEKTERQEIGKIRWNFWTVILAALITSGAAWKIIEIIAAAVRTIGQGR